MGDPRKVRKKFETPGHPWISSRIEEERAIVREFGLRNKREVWKMGTTLKQFKDRAKRLLALSTDQARTEEQQLLQRLERLGLIAKGAGFDEILGLDLRDLLNRRLQTILLKKNLARTPKQARQMITHRHVKVDGKVITSPSYLVTLAEEATVEFANRSAFFNESHPERFSEEELQRKQAKEDAKKATKKEDAEDAAAFDEKSIEEAEVLVGEKKAKKGEEAKEAASEPAKAPATVAAEKSADDAPAKKEAAEEKVAPSATDAAEKSADDAPAKKEAAEEKVAPSATDAAKKSADDAPAEKEAAEEKVAPSATVAAEKSADDAPAEKEAVKQKDAAKSAEKKKPAEKKEDDA